MRPALRLALLAAALLLALAASIRLGAVHLSLAEIVDAARGVGDPSSVAIVRELRLPRSLLAALVGAALAASGAVFQALLRNPLAEPYILGVSGGAALGAVGAIVLGLGSWNLPAAAFAGAVLAIALVLRIAWNAGRALDTRVLLLAGVVVAAFFNACILLLLTRADVESFRSAIFWMMGSLGGATWRGVGMLALYLAPGAALLVALARPLDLLSLGEEAATFLGLRAERVKYLAYAVASLLTAASVAASGVIGFVGLVVPHVVRMLWGSGHRFLLPASALAGALFLVLTDALARTVAAPGELPVGVITAFVGVPFFVWLLKRPPLSAPTRAGDAPPVPAGTTLSTPGLPLSATGLAFAYGAAPVLRNVGIDVPAGGITAILGPNGAGKSTLLRLLLGTLRPSAGEVRIAGHPLGEWSRRDLARRVAVVTQGEEIAFPITVRELVALGRYPFLGSWRREGAVDTAAIEGSMSACGVAELADRPVQQLSGGERQRVRLARALAQQPAVLVLDEPTASLDMQHEMATFEFMREAAGRGTTVLLVTHNLNLAARYAHRVVVLDEDGRVAGSGTPAQVVTKELVERVYRWPVIVAAGPTVTPLGR